MRPFNASIASLRFERTHLPSRRDRARWAALVIASIITFVAHVWASATHPRVGRGGVPRTHPFGLGRSCDGCDVPGEWPLLTNGGRYCEDCAAYVTETTGALPVHDA